MSVQWRCPTHRQLVAPSSDWVRAMYDRAMVGIFSELVQFSSPSGFAYVAELRPEHKSGAPVGLASCAVFMTAPVDSPSQHYTPPNHQLAL